MTRSSKPKRKRDSYITGEKGQNRVRLYPHPRDGKLFLEYRDEAGEKKRVSLGYEDLTRGKVAANELAASLLKNEGPRATELTLKSLFDNYDAEVKAGRLKKTPAKVRHDARTRLLFEHCWGASTLVRNLDVTHWNAFIHQRRNGTLRPPGRWRDKPQHTATTRPIRNRQIEYDLRFLLAVCHWAERVIVRGRPLLEREPFKGLEIPKESSPRRPLVSAKEYEALRKGSEEIGGLIPLFLMLAHETGHRANAIRQLRWNDVDTADGRILWRAKTDKTEFEHHTLLSKSAIERLKAARKATAQIGDGWLFPCPSGKDAPMDRYAVLHWWSKLEKAAGLSPVKGRGWHSLRRKFANDAKRTGAPLVDIARLGGWQGPETLLRVYMQPDDASMKSVMDKLEFLRASGE